MVYPEKEKVLAYIIRRINRQTELLLFKHRDFPEAGWQVPAGTVEFGEDHQAAVLREVKEESGLTQFSSIRLLDQSTFLHPLKKEVHHRFFYQLEIEGQVPDEFTHRVSGSGEDEDLIFQYHWIKLTELPSLAAAQGCFLARVN
ncbi:MAG: NUDIX domain-containing protein [Saprospiraceae bacterium]